MGEESNRYRKIVENGEDVRNEKLATSPRPPFGEEREISRFAFVKRDCCSMSLVFSLLRGSAALDRTDGDAFSKIDKREEQLPELGLIEMGQYGIEGQLRFLKFEQEFGRQRQHRQ